MPKRKAKPTGSAADFVPPRPTLKTLRAAAEHCRGCHLYTTGTQTVFGEGPATARILVVGEQPGDAEDSEGRPFVGPSGKLLDRALSAVRITSDWAPAVFATVHPSAVLRAPRADRDVAERLFIADVRKVARHLSRNGTASPPGRARRRASVEGHT